ncbi:MAG: hypothetical protein HC799_14295 [Limnothrix sp. RL_2_0]|nr:hypothetical protein [Limnothrix sp. RL_2_0]
MTNAVLHKALRKSLLAIAPEANIFICYSATLAMPGEVRILEAPVLIAQTTQRFYEKF